MVGEEFLWARHLSLRVFAQPYATSFGNGPKEGEEVVDLGLAILTVVRLAWRQTQND